MRAWPACLMKMDPGHPPLSEHSVLLGDLRVSTLEYTWQKLLPERFADGLSFFLRRNEFDVVVTECHGAALVFGFLSRLFGRTARHVAKELYLNERVLGSPLKRLAFRVALADVDCVVVNAMSERRAYADFLGISLDRVVFTPWSANVPLSSEAEDRGYVFAAGRSMRDWETLFESARSLHAPFVVVAGHSDIASLSPPPNMSVLRDLGHAEYLEKLRGARIVVLPLAATVRSTGQAVALEAMAMRKALVAADSPGLADYVRDERNGLLYRAGDHGSLTRQLQRLLCDPDLRHRLGEAAATEVRETFNRAAYSKRLFEIVSGLMKNPPR
jgi:glycosyltransferase involved in cell wall biosynthesis